MGIKESGNGEPYMGLPLIDDAKAAKAKAGPLKYATHKQLAKALKGPALFGVKAVGVGKRVGGAGPESLSFVFDPPATATNYAVPQTTTKGKSSGSK